MHRNTFIEAVFLVLIVGVMSVGLSSCGSGSVDGDGNTGPPSSDCEAIGRRFANLLESIPRNQGLCVIYRGQLAAYTEVRPQMISRNCFGPGQLAEWDSNIEQLQEGVRASCEDVPSGPDSQSFGGIALHLMDGCGYAYGISSGYPTRSTALNDAVDECIFHGGSFADCSAGDTYTQCAAIAFGEDSSTCWLGAKNGSTLNSARSNALSRCREQLSFGAMCQVLAAACN